MSLNKYGIPITAESPELEMVKYISRVLLCDLLVFGELEWKQ